MENYIVNEREDDCIPSIKRIKTRYRCPEKEGDANHNTHTLVMIPIRYLPVTCSRIMPCTYDDLERMSAHSKFIMYSVCGY